MDTNTHLDNIDNIIFIVSQKEEITSVQLSLEEHSVFSKRFSTVLDSDTFYCSIYCIKGIDFDLIKQPLYETIDISKEFGRCVIIEWKYDINFFSVYGTLPYKINADGKVRYAIDDKREGGTEAERETFLNAIRYANKESKDIGGTWRVYLHSVEEWFFRVSCFYSNMTEKLLQDIESNGLSKFF